MNTSRRCLTGEVEEDGRLTEALMTEPLQINDAFLESFKGYPEVFGEEFGSRKIVFPTTAMLAQSWGAVVEVARHLREQGVVEGAEVHAIVRQERA
jgi:hypothetical protein